MARVCDSAFLTQWLSLRDHDFLLVTANTRVSSHTPRTFVSSRNVEPPLPPYQLPRIPVSQEMMQHPCLRLGPPPTTSLGSLQNFMRKLVGDPGAGRLLVTAVDACCAGETGVTDRGGRESGRGTLVEEYCWNDDEGQDAGVGVEERRAPVVAVDAVAAGDSYLCS